MRPILKVDKDKKQLSKEQRQAVFDAILDAKVNGKLTLNDIDEKLNIIIKMIERDGG